MPNPLKKIITEITNFLGKCFFNNFVVQDEERINRGLQYNLAEYVFGSPPTAGDTSMLSSHIKAEVLYEALVKVKTQKPDEQYELKKGMEYPPLPKGEVIKLLPHLK
jgi:hypothetical protein